MNYQFKSLPIIPTSKELVDIVLSKTQRKTPTEVHPQFKITRIRKFYMRKVKFTQTMIEEKLQDILEKFPKLDDIHPFYADLLNVLYDRDHYKLALGRVRTALNLIGNVERDYIRMLKFSDSLYRAKSLKIAALGRMATILKKLNNSFTYLEEVRKHLSRLPGIDPHTRTLIITGYPNVGKSSFMVRVTNAKVEVCDYAFTTKSLYVGHTDYDYIPWQVIDTPGLLDRPLEERNTIEMQAVTALAHLNACILYFIDISETCGYTIDSQVALYQSLKPLFKSKPLGIVLTKIDIQSYDDLPEAKRAVIEDLIKTEAAFSVQVSNESTEGISNCKAQACESLRAYRDHLKTKRTVTYERHMPTVAQPKPRDSVTRPACIPQNFIADKLNGAKPDRINYRDVQEANGGAGVYYLPEHEHFDLEDEEWKYDIVPEIMNGKNVADFYDPDIVAKLIELEKEEDMLADAHVPFDYTTYQDVCEIHNKIHMRRLRLQRESSAYKGKFNPKKPTDAELGEGLEDLGIDPTAALGRKRGRSIRRLHDIQKDVEDPSDLMEVEDPSEEHIRKKFKAKERTLLRSRSKGAKKVKLAPSIANRGTVGEADRHVYDLKPKHLYSGKRGAGKTQRR